MADLAQQRTAGTADGAPRARRCRQVMKAARTGACAVRAITAACRRPTQCKTQSWTRHAARRDNNRTGDLQRAAACLFMSTCMPSRERPVRQPRLEPVAHLRVVKRVSCACRCCARHPRADARGQPSRQLPRPHAFVSRMLPPQHRCRHHQAASEWRQRGMPRAARARAAQPSRHAAREQVCMTRVHAEHARARAPAASFAALRRPRVPLTATAAAAGPMQRSALRQLRCSRRTRPRQQHAERLQGKQRTMRAPACACAVWRRAQPAATAQQ